MINALSHYLLDDYQPEHYKYLNKKTGHNLATTCFYFEGAHKNRWYFFRLNVPAGVGNSNNRIQMAPHLFGLE